MLIPRKCSHKTLPQWCMSVLNSSRFLSPTDLASIVPAMQKFHFSDACLLLITAHSFSSSWVTPEIRISNISHDPNRVFAFLWNFTSQAPIILYLSSPHRIAHYDLNNHRFFHPQIPNSCYNPLQNNKGMSSTAKPHDQFLSDQKQFGEKYFISSDRLQWISEESQNRNSSQEPGGRNWNRSNVAYWIAFCGWLSLLS